MSVLAKEKRVEVLNNLVEGVGIRSTAELTGTGKDTVNKLQRDLGEGSLVLHDELMRDLHSKLVQADEQWNFVRKKQKRVKPEEGDDPAIMGDQWTYVAQDVVHRAIISFLVGKRTIESARAFALDLRSRIRGRFQLTVDGHKPYVDAFREACGDSIDFAQLVKRYESDEDEARGLRIRKKRYIGSERVIVGGAPDGTQISTSRIERTNLSCRMEQSRFGRKTLRHSKDLRHHKAAVALYFTYFNLCRIHEQIDAAPAVALGVTPREWSLGELIEAALDLRHRVAAVEAEPAVESAVMRPRLVVVKGGRR